jgi:hypothetical protein
MLPVDRLLIQLNAFHALNRFKYKYVVVVRCDAVQTRRHKLPFPKHWHPLSLHDVTTQNNMSSTPPWEPQISPFSIAYSLISTKKSLCCLITIRIMVYFVSFRQQHACFWVFNCSTVQLWKLRKKNARKDYFTVASLNKFNPRWNLNQIY